MKLFIPNTENKIQSFQQVATWTENAVDLLKEKDSEYDPNSEAAATLYDNAVDCIAQMWLCIVNSHPQAKIIFSDALDRAEAFDKKEKNNG
jgi:hypothetical protein